MKLRAASRAIVALAFVVTACGSASDLTLPDPTPGADSGAGFDSGVVSDGSTPGDSSVVTDGANPTDAADAGDAGDASTIVPPTYMKASNTRTGSRFGILALGRKESLRGTAHEQDYTELDAVEKIYRRSA